MMKKALKRLILLLLVLVFMLGAVPQAAALTLPELKVDITDKFTDANFLAAVRAFLGKGASDKVYTTDVSKITSLSVSKRAISSLAGIAYFRGLETLICNSNNLSSLDVSNNTNLSIIGCADNKLTSLDVSKNTKLKSLLCSHNYLPSESAIIGLNKSQLVYFTFDPQTPTPSAPQNLSAKPGDGKVDLSWNLPVYGGTSAITSFEVSNNNWTTWITTGNTNNHTITGLKNGQSYTFRVRAVNSSGKGLEASVQLTPVAQPFYQNASDWAVPELAKAYDAGLIPEILKGLDMKKPISREEFAELAVQLYETATGKRILVTDVNPFTDTTNHKVLKAYQVGITTGTSATTFSPHMLITREQCATMLYRAIKAILPNADYSTAGIPDFPDQEHIASWAVEETKYMAKLGIILGNEKGYFMPKPLNAAHEASGYGMASREAAVLMTIRTFEKAK
jgi:hypothetical protein